MIGIGILPFIRTPVRAVQEPIDVLLRRKLHSPRLSGTGFKGEFLFDNLLVKIFTNM